MNSSRPLFDMPTCTGLHSVSLQTPAYLSSNSPRKRKLRKKLSEEVNLKKRLEKTVIELKKQLEETKTENNCLKLCEMYLPPTMYMLVKNYLTNKYKSPNGQRYINEITQFAYTIYHLGPKVYNFLQSHFNLPHLHTLKKISVQNIDKNVQDKIQNDHKYSKI
uniref:THAP9-like helix-turn-helix domain-containing protein n=1 Tax=Schizaphis graminum TaxID=13262 RepID=A0A2S2NV33_SCHGA